MKSLKLLKGKKGFTLIEIIVVLVIIGILVAATVPSMLGFVNQARGQQYASEARQGMIAAQAVYTQRAAAGLSVTGASILADANFALMVVDVSGVASGTDIIKGFHSITTNSDRVTGLRYTSNNYTVVIASNQTTIYPPGSTVP